MKYVATVSATSWKNTLLAALVVTFFFKFLSSVSCLKSPYVLCFPSAWCWGTQRLARWSASNWAAFQSCFVSRCAEESRSNVKFLQPKPETSVRVSEQGQSELTLVNFSQTNICSVHLTLSIQLCLSFLYFKPTNVGQRMKFVENPAAIQLSRTLSEHPVPSLQQSQSPSIVSEPSSPNCSGELWHGVHVNEENKKSREEKRKHPPYTHMLTRGRPQDHSWTWCDRNLPPSDMTVNKVPCFWPNTPVSIPLCNWLPSRVSAAGR